MKTSASVMKLLVGFVDNNKKVKYHWSYPLIILNHIISPALSFDNAKKHISLALPIDNVKHLISLALSFDNAKYHNITALVL